MSTKPDGGPAFPLFFPEAKNREGKVFRPRDERPGMSLRDYFAGQVIAAMGVQYGYDFGKPDFVEEARRAYEAADAMLAERAK